jgi:hypothetical protein
MVFEHFRCSLSLKLTFFGRFFKITTLSHDILIPSLSLTKDLNGTVFDPNSEVELINATVSSVSSDPGYAVIDTDVMKATTVTESPGSTETTMSTISGDWPSSTESSTEAPEVWA